MLSRPAEPVSPELILVAPPEEAERAREQLDETPPPNWEEFLADIRSRPEPSPADDEPAPETWAAPPRRRRRQRTIVAAVVVLAALAAAAVTLLRDHSRRQPSSRPSSPVSAAAPTPTPTTPAHRAARPNAKAKAPRKSAPRKAAPVKPKHRASRPAKRSAPRASGFVPARVFSWAATPGSRQYHVQFFRNGQKVLDVRATKPRLVLPKTFTFRPGQYRWTVVPIAANGQARPAVVNSTFVVK